MRRCCALRVTGDAGQDLICGFGPDKRFGIFVMHVNVFTDGSFQFFHAAEHAPPNSLVGEFGEPALDQVNPGTVSGSVVDMKTWTLREPFSDKGGFVSSVVVHNDMHLESGRNLLLDDIEKLTEFQGAMPALELGNHLVGF